MSERQQRAQFSSEVSSALPPHHVEHEAGALACVFDCPNPDELFRQLSLDLFYDERHRTIYSAVQDFSRDNELSLVNLIEFCQQKNLTARAGGFDYLSGLPDAKVSVHNWSSYLESLKEYATRRAAVSDAAQLSIIASDPAISARDIARASSRLLDSYATNGHASKLALVSARDFLAENISEPPQIIKGLLHQGSKFCIGGASKACKTWALLDLAVSVNAGRPWILFETTRGPVLYINFEVQKFAWQKRLEIVCARRDIQDVSNLHLLNLRGQTSNYADLIPQLILLLKTHPFVLIIIDPIYKLYGNTDENSAGDVALLLNSIEHLATESGAAVAYASHFSKGNQSQKEILDRVSGSGVFARDPDSFLTFTKHAEDDCFTVESVLRNFASVSPFVVKWDFPLLMPQEHLNPEDLKKPGGRPKTYSESNILSALGDSTLSSTDFLKTCQDKFEVSPATFYRLIKSLEFDGKLLKSKINGKWQKITKTA